MAPNTSRCRCEQTTSRIPKTSREPIGCQRSPENVLLSLIVVAPGFIAVYTAIIIGGLEESLSDGRLLGASIAAAFIIDPLFFWGYTLFGGEITDPTAAVRLFSKEDSGQSEFSYSHFSL